MDAGILVGALIGVVLGTVVNGILIWIVGKLGIGMKVDGFGSALLAGFLVALGGVLAGIVWQLTGGTPATGLEGAITNLIIAAAVLFAIGKALKGVTVDGVLGAIIAALAIAAVSWGISYLLSTVVAA